MGGVDQTLLLLFFDMDKQLLREVNEYLDRELGLSLFGIPNYRVIWSTGNTEKRLGTFSDYYGKIFLRQVTEVREVLKYPNDQDRWILERLESTAFNRELVEPYSYEPMYVFKDKKGFFLPLNMKAIRFYVHAIKNPIGHDERRNQLADELEAEERKEIEDFLDILHDTGRSPLFAYEDSVFMDSTKRKGVD